MIVIAERLLVWLYVFEAVSWLAGDSRLQQSFSLRIFWLEGRLLSPISPLPLISLETGTLKSPLAPVLAALSPILLYFY